MAAREAGASAANQTVITIPFLKPETGRRNAAPGMSDFP
jgi:hypothetical protein